jgi:hypothetical protein
MTSTTYEASAAAIIERYEQAEVEFEAAVAAMKDAILIENDIAFEVDGEVLADYDELKRRGAAAVTAALVRSRDERATAGVTPGDLFNAVLPVHTPYDEANLIERRAMDQLTRHLWGITQTAENGYVQRSLTDGLVLARSKVHRGNDPVQVAFVTDNDELIVTESLQPELDALAKRAAKVGAKATMIVTRRPELAAAVRRAVSAGGRKAITAAQPSAPELDELPPATD